MSRGIGSGSTGSTAAASGCAIPSPAPVPPAAASPPAVACACPAGRVPVRPSAARTLKVDTPVAAAIWRSRMPCPSSPAIRATISGVSFDARRGPLRAGTSPATPPVVRAWSHRQMVAGSTPNASATCPWLAAFSRTSCTAASRRPASSPASHANVASPCTHTSPPPGPVTTPTPGAISSAAAGSSGRGSWVSIPAIIHPIPQPSILAYIFLQNGPERTQMTRKTADQSAKDTRTARSMSGAPGLPECRPPVQGRPGQAGRGDRLPGPQPTRCALTTASARPAARWARPHRAGRSAPLTWCRARPRTPPPGYFPVPPGSYDNLYTQQGSSGWKAYGESMPSSCFIASAGGDSTGDAYHPRHIPALYYTNLNGGSTFSGTNCNSGTQMASNAVPLALTTDNTGRYTSGSLVSDVNNGTLPKFSTVTLPAGGRHQVVLHVVVNGTSSSVDVSLDGTAVPDLSLTGQNMGTNLITSLQMGDTATGRT